tara:strand:+ start:40 stop:405 length:366 start_codon:yes stop_codon:yes gene_type:complete
MELTLQANKSGIFIKNYEDSCFYIGDEKYKHNIIILGNEVLKWDISDSSNLKIDDFENILKKNPEILIVGTGTESILPDIEVIRVIQSLNIGVEFMKTDSACKTFNLLISEERNVAGTFLV